MITALMMDSPNQRIVSIFKDYLIFDDSSCECLKRFYSTSESQARIQNLTAYYLEYAQIFPSYAVLLFPQKESDSSFLFDTPAEGVARYMFRNIRKKQRVIDEQFEWQQRRLVSKQTSSPLKQFFTPEFISSCLKFEKHIQSRQHL